MHSIAIDQLANGETVWSAEKEGVGRESRTVWPLERADGLTGEDVRNLQAILAHAMADNTKANYRGQWLRFARWARQRGVRALPADPAHVAAYLAERIEREGHKPATLRAAASAIAFIHRVAGTDDPCLAVAVRRALSGATRKAGRRQKQAPALTAHALARIRATAYKPRRMRDGRSENTATARRRGSVDMALISLMRDALLRVSEAAALTWGDIVAEPNGTGRLQIRRSKTDPEGEGEVAFPVRADHDAPRSDPGLRSPWGQRLRAAPQPVDQANQAGGASRRAGGSVQRPFTAGGDGVRPRTGGHGTPQFDARWPLEVAGHASALHPERNRGEKRRCAILRPPAQPGGRGRTWRS